MFNLSIPSFQFTIFICRIVFYGRLYFFLICIIKHNTMNWNHLPLVFLFLLSSNFALSQSPNQKNALSFSASIFDYYSLFNDQPFQADGNLTYGAKVAYHRNLVGPLNLELPLRLGTITYPTPENTLQDFSENRFMGSFDALLQLQAFKSSFPIVPFLSGGVGVGYTEDLDTDIQFPLGAGLEVKLADKVYLHARSDYRLSNLDVPTTDKTFENLNHNIGLKVFIGKSTEETPDEEQTTEKDSDGDGISDLLDECPNEIGTAATQGCPDSDGDGVVDASDACPDLAGTLATNGCPDRDNDGVADKDDECPDEAGSIGLNGCPDSDADGVKDSEDECPDQFGSISTNGCPDSDGDGVTDQNDRCPTERGDIDNFGCPTSNEIDEKDQATLDFAAQNLEFEINSSYFKSTAYAILDQVLDILQRYPQYAVSIEGYTDNVGESKYNQWLSERRAKRCYDYFLEKGIPATRMKYAGFGEENPIASNSNAQGRKRNRRVEFNLFLP